MTFRKVNNLSGWLVFLIALTTYTLTREARGSLWDTGEFIASAKGLQLPHPPGAPLFTLLGRFFIILFGDNPLTAASAVNFMSALASAATILFLFWSITHFGRKLFVGTGEELTKTQTFTTVAAGLLGALAYTFSDSFWFSAVEGEVYALSSFFTALVFWAMLKWELADERAAKDQALRLQADRWIVFLFFMMGLSIGVHLLNLLTIPAIVMIYYYRRYQVTTKGAIYAFLIGCAITGLVQVGVIQYSMKAAGQFDILFVNTLGLPFFSGFAFYFIALLLLLVIALRFKEKSVNSSVSITWAISFLFLLLTPLLFTPGIGISVLGFLFVVGAGVALGYSIKPSTLRILKLSLWCYGFIMLGYFMYFTAMIRSNANPSIDMNNVDNPINLVYYLSREQYGSAPLVYGPHFAANPAEDVVPEKPRIEGEMRYIKGTDRYIPIGKTMEYNYKSEVKQLFPRIWDSSDDQYHAQFYADWLNLDADPERGTYQAPSYGDNLNWFFTYQMSHMYWRYFMWNFSGKQNDIQGMGNKRDGNWVTGISFLDNARLGDQSRLPESIRQNGATNYFFLIPFLLGVLGCVYQLVENRKDWIINFLLFFFTGIAIVLYLNQPGNQPRERDYAYVGSFYAFAIWIGLSLVAIARMASVQLEKKNYRPVIYYSSSLAFLVTFMSCVSGNSSGAMINAIAAGLAAGLLAAFPWLLGKLTQYGKRQALLISIVSIIGLTLPALMAQQGWDDHDRSNKTTAPDLARNYLESCAPNAILFTFGDNDTYPLWYAQEVEGIRTDVRVINNSLLGIDWYINQLRHKINNADAVDMIWGPEKIQGNLRNYVPVNPEKSFDQNNPTPLYAIMEDYVGMDGISYDGAEDPINIMPVTKFRVPVNKSVVLKNGTANPGDSILADMIFSLPETKRALYKNDLIILNIIAANEWKRPIYFTAPYGELGFGSFLRKEGLAYRLVPVALQFSQLNWVIDTALRKKGLQGTSIRDNNLATIYNNLINKYRFGAGAQKRIYFDEENRRHLLDIREIFAEAAGNLADAGKKAEARALLEKIDTTISTESLPYAMVSRFNSHNQTGLIYLEACYKADLKDKANKVKQALRKDLEQQQAYYNHLREENPDLYGGFERTEVPINERLLIILNEIEAKYN